VEYLVLDNVVFSELRGDHKDTRTIAPVVVASSSRALVTKHELQFVDCGRYCNTKLRNHFITNIKYNLEHNIIRG
jgi:hypothetical protein